MGPNGVTGNSASLNAVLNQYGTTDITLPFEVLNKAKFDRIYKAYFNQPNNTDQLIAALEQLSVVEYAERVPAKYTMETIPNDPSVPDVSYQLGLIRAYDAFDLHQGGGAVVAIVDDAVLTSHDDLAGNIIAGWDAADQDNDPNPPFSGPNAATPSRFSHGTHVAGIAGAVTNNETGVASIGWNNQLMAIKGTSDNASNPRGITAGFEGVAWAVANGANVINMSWGGPVFSESEYLVIEEAWGNGIILVAAAGNSSVASPRYPAAYGEGTTGEAWEADDSYMVVAVASIDANGARSIWGTTGFGGISGSNFGPWVDVAAYGTSIYSTVAGSISGAPLNSLYEFDNGTSMAAPLVAGLAGLMRSYNPSASSEETVSCLLNTANPDIYNHPDNLPGSLGSGRIDAFEALRCLATDCADNPIAVISPSSNFLCPNGTVELSANPGIAYQWSTGATTQAITVGQEGVYSVTVTFDGCTAEGFIELTPPTLIEAIVIVRDNTGLEQNDGIMCGGSSASAVMLTAYWGLSYQWNFANWTDPSLNLGGGANLPFSYEYSVTVTGVGGCPGVTDVVTGELLWLPLPEVSIDVAENSDVPNDGVVCMGEEATLTASGGDFYEWNTGEMTAAITVSPNVPTSYRVTVTDLNGCSSVEEVVVDAVDCVNLYFTCPCTETNSRNINAGEGTLLSDIYGGNAGQLPEDELLNTCLAINGQLIIDENYTIEGGEIRMQPGASIRVKKPAKLTIRSINNGNKIHGCSEMWRGIDVEPKARLYIEDSWIEDAQYAVQAQDASNLYLQGNTFNRNFVGVYTTPSYEYLPQLISFPEGPMKDNDFICTSGLLPGYVGQWPVVAAGDISFAGVEANDAIIDIGGSNDPESIANRFDGLRNGIWAKRSVINSYNCLIKNMNYGLPGSSTGYDAEGNGIFLDQSWATIIDNTIQDVSVGIQALASSLLAEKNTLLNNIDGINAAFAANRKVEILNNDVTFLRTGTRILNIINPTLLSITDNIYAHATGLSFPSNDAEIAIAVSNAVSGTGGGPAGKRISNNTINIPRNGCVGISIGDFGYDVDVNTITINNLPQDGAGFGSYGIQLLGASDNYLYSNTVVAASAFGIK